MALTEYYVDPVAGNDTTGTGSSGAPWATVQKALDTITSAAAGDRINVKAGTSDSLSSALSFATYGVPTTIKPLVIQGYTTSAADGGIGEIDGGGSVAIIDDVSMDSVMFADMKLGNTGSGHILSLDNSCSLIRCDLHTSSNSIPLDFDIDFLMVDCHVHSTTGSALLLAQNNARIINCYFDATSSSAANGALNLTGNDWVLYGSIIHCNHASARGMEFAGTDWVAQNNTFYNESAGTDTAIWSNSGGVATGCTILNNIIEGWSGSGGAPIKLISASSEGAAMVAGNLYFDNDTNAPTWTGQPPLIESGNTIPAASVLNDPSNGDFTVTTEAEEAGYHQVFRGLPSTTNKMDTGAAQRLEESGGGGGTDSIVGY